MEVKSESKEDAMLLASEVEVGTVSMECRWLPEAGKGKEMSSALQPSKGMWSHGPT